MKEEEEILNKFMVKEFIGCFKDLINMVKKERPRFYWKIIINVSLIIN